MGLRTYSIAEVLAGNGATLAPTTPSRPKTPPRKDTGADRLERGRRYLAQLGQAVQGEQGDRRTLRACAWLVKDLALSDSDALALLLEWDEGNAPAWGADGLSEKIANARKYGTHPEGAADGSLGLPSLSKSYASVCAVLRNDAARALVLGAGLLEFNEMTLTPTIDRKPITPEMLSAMRERCERKLADWKNAPLEFATENLQAALLQVAHERPYHPVKEYLSALHWDGEERLALLPGVAGAASSPINLSMLRKFMVAAAARALDPGCKHDATLNLVGPQGVGKSRLFRALAGPYFSDTPMTIGDKDSLLVLHSAWIHEWAELESVQRAARSHTVKAFLSSSEDLIRAPYERATRRYPRSCVIVGTTNDEQFLTDPTGGRRYWVVPVTRRIDVAAVEADRDQLWAEAVHAYRAGEPWYLTDAEEKTLRRTQQRHEVEDPWEDEILGFAEKHPGGVTTSGALDDLRIPPAQQTKSAAMRVAAVLVRAGFKRRRATISVGTRAWVYVKTPPRRPTYPPLIRLEVGQNGP